MHNGMSLRRVFALTLHYVYSIRRNPARLIEMFLWPSFELLIFMLLGQGVDSVSVNSIGTVIAVGALYWILTARIIQEVVAQITEDFFSKNIQNIMLAPVQFGEIILGLFLATLVKLVLSFSVLLALLLGFGTAELVSVFFTYLPLVAILLLFAGALGILSLTFVFLYGERMSFVGWVISTAAQVVSCVYYARSVLPFPLYELSFLTPSSYVFESIRSGSRLGLLVPLALCALYYAVSFMLVRMSFFYARKYGAFTKS